jgi:CIC family chloride channel protein
VIPLAKVVATSLSIGSGGSGGIFGPGMMIGGMLGALVWRIAYALSSHIPAQPAPFVIVGMMSLFGGIAHAPLAVMIMVAEMTGNLSLLAPAMIAVAISTALVGDNTIYRAQLRDRASSPFYRLQYRFPLLSSLLVREAMVRLPAEAQTAAEVHGGQAARRNFLLADETLDIALEQFGEQQMTSAPVVENGKVVGTLSIQDALKAYRRARTTPGLPEAPPLH